MDSENEIRYLFCGDTAISVEFGNEINSEINNRIKNLADALNDRPIKGVIECVPTYRSLLIIYNPGEIKSSKLISKIKKYISENKKSAEKSKRIFVIPVCYEGEYSPDMGNVCANSGLTEDEVIKIHSSKDYLIYMLGFLPGFPYLGGLDERIHTPRLPSPRTIIPPGSVGIGGKQTGIYPVVSPGGWQLIGRTPVKPYDPSREKPIIYSAGDYIRFKPVSENEYDLIKKQCDENTYYWEIIEE